MKTIYIERCGFGFAVWDDEGQETIYFIDNPIKCLDLFKEQHGIKEARIIEK